ncbi:CGNR zinc finger domain-containing protein [Amycolatopsis sp. NPDC051071]|uniref:CGNR zinc finger domain-containing protein n=1 Tax=Amycolatopsis sp. NPDC051071 TaxID=3154637 RepID=UPI00341A116F
MLDLDSLPGDDLAVNLADTVLLAVSPPVDLLDDGHDRFWVAQASRLPEGTRPPSPERTRRLRSAVREVFEAAVAAREPETWAVERVNAAAAAVPTSPRLTAEGIETDWHGEDGGEIALAAVAVAAIDLVSGPRAALLRRCGAHDCSMLFVAANSRRVWCTPSLCGNRVRVARHAKKG